MLKMRAFKIVVKLNFCLLLFVLTMDTYGFFIDYTENTELIQQRSGNDIKLQCGLKGLVDETKLKDVQIHWYFKQCRARTNGVNNCHDLHEDDWTQLPCAETFCKTDLFLRNVTEKYSGLYKCIIYPPYNLDAGQTLDIQLVRTYQLDVKNTSISVPEFLDSFPLNKTVAVGSQVVFQCSVHSEVHPTVKWFRRILESSSQLEYGFGSENFNAHIVKYNGQTYELLSTPREKYISNDIYLSKLILNSVSLQDEGYYACAAISYRGHRIREAYLQVYANDEVDYWTEYDDSDEGRTDPTEFLLLFLMPFGLAMLPLTFWLCYIIYRRRKSNQEHNQREQCLDKSSGAEQCML